MKRKLLSLFLAFTLLLTALPFNALAKDDILSREEHLALACEIFPEYRDKILGVNSVSAYSRSLSEREVVIADTRQVTENHVMTYAEYSDGETLIASSIFNTPVSILDSDSSSPFNKTVKFIDQATGGGATEYTVTLYVSAPYESDDEFIAENVKFTIVGGYGEGCYDCISSTGDISSSTTDRTWVSVHNQWETATSPARVQYNAEFKREGKVPFDPLIRLDLQNNIYTFTAS